MKPAILCAALVFALAAAWLETADGAAWPGVDETVVEKYATAAGRPPQRPLVDPGEGSLLLFLFLIAGAVGGFAAGYYFREVFPRKASRGRSR